MHDGGKNVKIELSPAQARELTGDKLYAYSAPVSQVDLVALLGRATKFRGQRVFFQSADRRRTLLGLGALRRWRGQSLAALAPQVERLRHQWVNLTPNEGACPLLLGGAAFDLAAPAAPWWGQLADGEFVLPEVLLCQTPTAATVTLLVSGGAGAANRLSELAATVEALLAAPGDPAAPGPVSGQELAVAAWEDLVEQTVAEIKAGRFAKVVLARQLAVSGHFAPAPILARLGAQQPNTYRFLVEDGSHFFLGATPERLLAASGDRFLTASVAGSAPRGEDPARDTALGNALLADRKNAGEHRIVVDRVAKSLAPFVTTVEVGERQLLKNRDLQHIYHPIGGARRPGVSFLEAAAALHPTPALGGEPRAEALAWLRDHEAGRGMYGGPVGWLSLREDRGELVVGLRSGVFTTDTGRLYAGCGIVAASQAASERAETRLKFQPMLRGISDQWTLK